MTPEQIARAIDEYKWHPDVLKWFPGYDYRKPVPGTIVDYSNPNNVTGHQQRAFTTYWAMQQCDPMNLGLDIGSCKSLTPYCIHVDLYGTGKSHEIYKGGGYTSDVLADGSDLSMFPDNAFPYLCGNHSLEHIPGSQYSDPNPDVRIVQVLANHWIRVLKPGGILALVIPDNAYFDVLAADRDHKHAWHHHDFENRVLNHVKHLVDILEFNTFNNRMSFNVLARKK